MYTEYILTQFSPPPSEINMDEGANFCSCHVLQLIFMTQITSDSDVKL